MCCMGMHDMDHSTHSGPAMVASEAQEDSLLDILKRRYALGELSLTQFEEMKKVLGLKPKDADVSVAGHAHHTGQRETA